MYVNTGYRVVYLTQKRKLTLESSINNYFLNTWINIEQIKCHSHVSEYGDSGKCENPKHIKSGFFVSIVTNFHCIVSSIFIIKLTLPKS